MKYAPYSFSKLSTHYNCNRKFKYAYIEKPQKDYKDMTALLKGGAVHNILENFPQQSTHKLAPQYQHIVDNFIKTNLGKKYLYSESIREYDFGLTTTLEPTTYNDKSALFRGSIDYVCVIDDILHLIDWKSGKAKPQSYQSYNQLMFYAIYFFKKYENIDKIKISYVYIEHENIENDILLERKYLNNYITELITLIKNVESDEIFEKNVTKLCEYCEYYTHCSESNL